MMTDYKWQQGVFDKMMTIADEAGIGYQVFIVFNESVKANEKKLGRDLDDAEYEYLADEVLARFKLSL